MLTFEITVTDAKTGMQICDATVERGERSGCTYSVTVDDNDNTFTVSRAGYVTLTIAVANVECHLTGVHPSTVELSPA